MVKYSSPLPISFFATILCLSLPFYHFHYLMPITMPSTLYLAWLSASNVKFLITDWRVTGPRRRRFHSLLADPFQHGVCIWQIGISIGTITLLLPQAIFTHAYQVIRVYCGIEPAYTSNIMFRSVVALKAES